MLRSPLLLVFFFFNDTATTEIYTLSLHDALPISEEAHDLRLLDAGLERERADAVLVQRPGDALVALVLAVDDRVFPAQLGLAHVEVQIVGRLPDLAERGADVVDRALVHGIVRQVELGGPDALRHDLHQVLDLGRRQRQLGDGSREPARPAQRTAPLSSATIATSLSPRPLRLISTMSPARQCPL